MISERNVNGTTIRTEVVLLFENVRITQKQIENGDTLKTSTVYLDKTEMDALIKDYQTKEVQHYMGSSDE